MIVPVVADISHHNAVNFSKIKAAGIVGVIHKATQGVGMTDNKYTSRRVAWEEELGGEWGAYSFATHDDPVDHARHFLDVARPDKNTLCCLDFEDNPKSQMSVRQAYDFMRFVEDKIGRHCWIYGGNRIREQITPACHLSSVMSEYFSQRPLWLCQYKVGFGPSVTLQELSAHIKTPEPWSLWTLLQYTGDGIGPQPHRVDGLEDGADLNVYGLGTHELLNIWPGLKI